MNGRRFAFVLLVLSSAAQLYGQFGTSDLSSKHGGHYLHNFYFPPAPNSTPWAPDGSPSA